MSYGCSFPLLMTDVVIPAVQPVSVLLCVLCGELLFSPQRTLRDTEKDPEAPLGPPLSMFAQSGWSIASAAVGEARGSYLRSDNQPAIVRVTVSASSC